MEKRLIRGKKIVPTSADPASASRRIIIDVKNAMSFRQLPHEHPAYLMIGQITMEWSFLEEILDNCIGTLADTAPAITACITAQMMGHAPRCLTIKALAHWRGLLDVEKATDGLQNALFEASELRNRAIHDRLLIEPTSMATFKEHSMSKKELHYGLKPFDSSELKRAIALIKKRQADCLNLYKNILDDVYEYYT
jgi:hypothetical protein